VPFIRKIVPPVEDVFALVILPDPPLLSVIFSVPLPFFVMALSLPLFSILPLSSRVKGWDLLIVISFSLTSLSSLIV
jgi:hypothetical protein